MRQSQNDRYDGAQLESLGTFIRARRTELGLTQTQLGRRLGYYQERISAIERGSYGLPSLAALADLAYALEVDLSDLVEVAGFSLRRTDAKASAFGLIQNHAH